MKARGVYEKKLTGTAGCLCYESTSRQPSELRWFYLAAITGLYPVLAEQGQGTARQGKVFHREGKMRVGQSALKRQVYVNGVHCESMTAGAKEASKLIGRQVHVWEIQRVLNGNKQIADLDISEISPSQRAAKR